MHARLSALLVAAGAVAALTSCGDPTAIKARLTNFEAKHLVYSLNGTSPILPSGVEVRRAVAAYPGPNFAFDLAFDLGCFHGILQDRRANYLDEVDRILAPGGFWLMYGFLTADADHAQPGMEEVLIRALCSRFLLLSRRDGFDNRERNSAWFLFQKSV